MTVKPSPVTPSPAATLVLLRDRPAGGFETLLVQRHANSKFAAGDYVFPGGKVGTDDNPDDAARWCAGLTEREAAHHLDLDNDPRAALAYWIGAIREVFEEVGLLLAYRPDGGLASLDDARFEEYRAACQKENRAFWGMIRAERFVLATDRLRYFAHWITPEENPIRFDTRFFVAEAPATQVPRVDGHEVVDLKWLAPAEALAARDRGEISLRLPTMKNLGLFTGAASIPDAVTRVASREIRPIRPRVVIENGTRRSLLPGDPGYY